MRFFLLPLFLFTTYVHAASPEDCINLARDYLLTLEQEGSVKDSIYSRERFMANCNSDHGFGQELTRLVIDNRVLNAIHVRPDYQQTALLAAF